jgi:expansin (peptidoglycan-binding protein)
VTEGQQAHPGRRKRRWLAVGGAAGVAVVVALTLAMRVGAAPACAAVPVAAPPVGGTVHQGKSTFYDSNGAGGNCSNVQAPADRLYVALGPSEYAAAAACGGYLDVTGPKGQVRVLVMDQCPECEPGHLDLSKEAFARIADPVQGIVPVTYRAVVNPPLGGPITFRMKEGTSQFWFAVLVADHGNPLKSVEARTGGSGWRAAARQTYNYWVIDSGLGAGPYAIRVTDVYGDQVVAEGIRLSPGQTQKSTVRLYGGAAGRVPTTSPARSATPARSSPSAPTDGSLSVGSSTPSSGGIPTPLTVDSVPDQTQAAASCGQ